MARVYTAARLDAGLKAMRYRAMSIDHPPGSVRDIGHPRFALLVLVLAALAFGGWGLWRAYGPQPANAGELLAVDDVDGALVGGASLVAGDFLAIARAYL